MASRTWYSSALRQCQTALSRPQQKPTANRLFSTTPSAAALKDHADPSSKISDMFAKQRPSQTGDLRNLVETSNAFSKNRERRDVTQKDLAATHQTDSYVQQMTRRWKKGDVYAPKDLSPVEMRRWKGFLTPQVDIVDVMGFNPVDNYRNFALLAEHMTAMGRIIPGRQSGLRAVNQRKMAKAIRRAVGLGLHPSCHLHPEMLLSRSKWISHGTLPSTQLPNNAKLARYSKQENRRE